MKTIQLVGSRNKSDFTIFLSHILSSLEKRVLVVDTTQQEVYRNGFARLEEGQHLYDFQKIDILAGAKDWLDVEQLLRKEGESSTKYDVIIVDTDQISVVANEWPIFDERYYIGDDDRVNQLRDVELLHLLFDETDYTEIKRVTFKSAYELTANFFDNLINHRAKWRSMNYMIEPDELILSQRIQMGHDQMIPFTKLNKQYKECLYEIVSELFEMHIEEVQEAVKPSFFKFGRKKQSKNEKKQKQEKQELAYGNSNS